MNRSLWWFPFLFLLACNDGADGASDADASRAADGGASLDIQQADDLGRADTGSSDAVGADTYLGPCIPNPCTKPPPPVCLADGSTLILYALVGVCTDSEGHATCEYAERATDCGKFGYLDGCRNGPCKDGCTGECGDMVRVEAGPFWMGCDEGSETGWCDWDNQPYHEVHLDEYAIDRTEVTNEAVAHYLNMKGETYDGDFPPFFWGWDNYHVQVHYHGGFWQVSDGLEDYPAAAVTWYGAADFCKSAGKRLCTEAEWEKAARGDDGRKYPWGDEPPSCDKLVASEVAWGCSYGAEAVGSYPAGASPYGVLDMSGNVWEWVADWYDEKYYEVSPAENPPGPDDGTGPVIRGGAWDSFGSYYLTTYDRYDGSYPPGEDCGVGFATYGARCCRSLQ